MAEVALFSPRKITPQNKRHLPESHDPNKRITYVQITLEENEIAEAIRNYIRAQVPVRDGEELPVVLTAGRGENGHSATITLSVAPLVVPTVNRPVDALATFNETAVAAARRNKEDADEDAQQEIPEEIEIRVPDALTRPGGSNPNRLPPKQTETESPQVNDAQEEDCQTEEETVTPNPAPAPKKSNLFGTSQNLEPAVETSKATPAVEPPKRKSIFDGLK